jgi:hypothetical protein
MKRIFAAALAAACVAGFATDGFARGAHRAGHAFARASGVVCNPTVLLGSPTPHVPIFQNRIPAPLPAPAQPPVINGPPSRSPYGGVM